MRSTFVSLLASLVLAGCAASSTGGLDAPVDGEERAAASESAAATESAQGRVGSHGMIVAGAPGQAFLSHIPMFGAPHDVQLVVAGTFSALDGAPLSAPVSFSDRLFSFLPDRLSLDALRTGSLHELRGTLFLGNFEAGGRPLPSRVRFTVSRVVHQHILDAQATQPELGYLVFGSRAQTFAVHRVAGSPGFDEVLRVSLDGDAPTDAELAVGVDVRVAGSHDEASQRLGLGTAPRSAKAGTRTFTLRSVTTLSCLEGPDFASPCPDQQDADQ